LPIVFSRLIGARPMSLAASYTNERAKADRSTRWMRSSPRSRKQKVRFSRRATWRTSRTLRSRLLIPSRFGDNMPLRLVFMGTPDFAVPTLIEIVGRGHEVVAVYTRAAKPAGRGMEMQVSPVEREARRFGIPVLTPKTLRNDEALAAF